MKAEEAPGPVFYLTPGEQVTALSLQQTRLLAGTATGEIISYNTNSWREEGRRKVFRGGGVLWLELLDMEGVKTMVAQGRFDGVKMFHCVGLGEEWREVASFSINHTGFCAGYLHHLQSDLIMTVASEQSKVLVLVNARYYQHIKSIGQSKAEKGSAASKSICCGFNLVNSNQISGGK